MRDRGTATSVSEAVDLPLSQIGIKLVGTNFLLGRELKQKLGSEGLRPGIFFRTTPFRSLENALLEKLPLKEAKDHYRWEPFQ